MIWVSEFSFELLALLFVSCFLFFSFLRSLLGFSFCFFLATLGVCFVFWIVEVVLDTENEGELASYWAQLKGIASCAVRHAPSTPNAKKVRSQLVLKKGV